MNNSLQITKLGLKDLDNVLALHKQTIQNLSEEQKYFSVNRSKEDFIRALTAGNMHMFGIYIGSKLVAQSMLNFPQDGQSRDIPEFAGTYKNSDIAIYQAVQVDPEYRGMGLMARMLQAREDMAVLSGKKVAICKIAADNSFSWRNALKHGMQILQAGVDQSGHEKFYLQKKLNTLQMPQNLMGSITISLNHPHLKKLMFNMAKIGRVGVWDKDVQSLTYLPAMAQTDTSFRNRVCGGYRGFAAE